MRHHRNRIDSKSTTVFHSETNKLICVVSAKKGCKYIALTAMIDEINKHIIEEIKTKHANKFSCETKEGNVIFNFGCELASEMDKTIQTLLAKISFESYVLSSRPFGDANQFWSALCSEVMKKSDQDSAQSLVEIKKEGSMGFQNSQDLKEFQSQTTFKCGAGNCTIL